MEPQGTITVRAPSCIDIDQINSILNMKRYWIYKSIAEVKELNKTKVDRSLVSGEGYLYMGKSYRLKIEKGLSSPFSLNQGFFNLDESQVAKAKDHFINFYKTQGRVYITKRVEYFAKRMGAEAATVRVMDLKKRWASRSKRGLNFHWKVMLAPATIIDYIVVHELAHIKQANHSVKFWEMVGSVLPNYAEKKEWLRLNGANLDV